MVKVCGHILANVSDDEALDSKALLRVTKFISLYSIDVNEKAYNINGDYRVNIRDLIKPTKYLAG